MKKLILIAALFLGISFCFSQTKPKDTITRKAIIGFDQKGNKVSFKPETPPLIQIAGAPPANYTYFWELGDGHYSREKEPKHTYKKKGDKTVRLAVTNNYDNGKPPATRPKTVAVTELSETDYQDIASIEQHDGFLLQKNREPVPDEEIIVVMSYQNLKDYSTNGKLYLFYNDKQFKDDNFGIPEARAYENEKEKLEENYAFVDDYDKHETYLASNANAFFRNPKNIEDLENLEETLEQSKALYRNSKVFEFDSLAPKQTRNLFFTFRTTPEMIKDTSATLTIRGVFVPDRNYKNHKVKNLEMEIVTSHDPNKMSSNGFFMNYRLVRFKTLNFKTRFQNDGEGPARKIKLETDVPDIFDKSTLKIVDMYPKCEICPKNEEVNYSCLDTIVLKNQIHFTFKNIYLPGSNQKNVMEKDSTKGFVKYSLKFGKDFHKVKTKSRTAIIFDKNEPIITNYAVTRFSPGISIGVRTGYNYFPDQENPKSYFLGATISPYKSYRWYLQSELYYNYMESSSSSASDPVLTQISPPLVLSNGTVLDVAYVQKENSQKTVRNLAEVVPVSLRYNLNNYIGFGLGPQFSVALDETMENNSITRYFQPLFNNPDGPRRGEEVARDTKTEKTKTKAFEKMQSNVFADVTFGFSRIGPSLGVRYVWSFENDFSHWQFYAIWKF
ncbi:MAG: PKD domain-containing protein [Flavobacterium lindanitolerans]|uniref:PKD domain-containing protein n=1 Tax=Flavobacterium lindanitolerans TaxID=428988 RepID=UPI001A36A846|nr:PKD domain-containing protein [Flavobacterium lindanitolerans]MBL7866787.1 PKD domain-containing protein [Flavobacterium lindanitolerans]